MKIATIVARVLLGPMFVVFGSNKFLHFFPMPPEPGQAGAFLGALFQTHYLYGVALCEVTGGALLLIGRYVSLGLTLLGPVMPVAVLWGIINLEGHLALTSTAIMAAFAGCTVILMVAVADALPARGVCVGVAIGQLINTLMMMASNPLVGKLTEEYGSKVAAGATAIVAACGVICIALLAWLVRPRSAQQSEPRAAAA